MPENLFSQKKLIVHKTQQPGNPRACERPEKKGCILPHIGVEKLDGTIAIKSLGAYPVIFTFNVLVKH
jgi:hypothetical protein